MTSTTTADATTNGEEQPKTLNAETKAPAPEEGANQSNNATIGGDKEDGKPEDGKEIADGKEKEDESKEDGSASPKKVAAPKPTVHKVDYETDVVYLYQFGRCPTLPSASPFCLKVENYLRMAEIRYENVDHKMRYKSKKGQLPFVELNGQEIADSDIIIRDLSVKFEKDLDDGLTDDQRHVSHTAVSMLNNHTSWVVRWWRYNNPGEFLKAAQLDIKRTLNSRLPKGVLNFLFRLGFKSNVKQAIGHGLGRHTSEEIYDFGKSDLKTLSGILADKDYFFGKEPHLLDCVAFAHLCQFIYVPFEGMKEWIETETPNLSAFVNRMKERYWSDWDEMCQSLELNTHLPKKEGDEAKKEDEIKEEEKKKKEEKKREKEEKKKEKEEKKRKEKEEKERKKKEEEEQKKQEKEEGQEKVDEPEKEEKKEGEGSPADAASGTTAAASTTATTTADESDAKKSDTKEGGEAKTEDTPKTENAEEKAIN